MIGKKKNIVLAGAIGNALEWYDFTIYAFFVPVIATLFFPAKTPFLSILTAFGVFAVGFLVRPVGAILFGYIGDHVGRKKALILSMMMMSFPTFLIGLLPTYHTIGVLAALLLIGLRIIQGLAVSGELTTATVFLIEHADNDKRGIAGSLAMSGALIGIVLSSIVASGLTEILSSEALTHWGWRLPFLFGGILGIIGLLVRLHSIEPVLYEQCHKNQLEQASRSSLLGHMVNLNHKMVFIGICLTSIMAIANYYLIGYFNTFLVETQKMPLREVTFINSIAITVQLILTLVMGRLSDKIGRKRVLGSGMVVITLFAYPVFWLLSQHNIYHALLGEVVFAIAAGSISGLIPTTLAEMFATHHRNTGISMSYNVALALFGGTAPLIAITLVASTQNLFAPAWYLMICATIAFLALQFLSESYQKAL